MVINSPCLTDKKELDILGQTATEFHQIVDFLSTCSINYALTVSPTIYAPYIEQFCNTATSKTVNSVKQIHVIVDGKAVVIIESSVRNDLLFDDEDGITCLTNDEIFENLALMGDSDNIIRTQTMAMPNVDIPLGIDTCGSPRRQETMRGAPAQTRSERVLKQPNEPPLLEGHTSGSREGRMEHTFELMDTVPPIPHDSPLTGGYTPVSDEENQGVSTAGEGVSTAAPRTPPTTTTVFDDEDERQRQEDDTNDDLAKQFDEIQARIDVDHELAVRLTHEEQEKYIIK
ncbi:hypothetical protein Tco_1411946, partial [Tanacetum coccineum]